jgi:hypothetical protein
MPIPLTEEQCQALDGPRGPVRLIDPRTQATYVLLPEDVYERLKATVTEDFQPAEAYPAIDRALAEGWNDPKMDDYDRYEELKQ